MTAFISKFIIKLDKPLWGLSFFYICSVALLWNSSGTALVDDSLGILNNFQKTGWSDFLNSYGMTSLYFLHDAFSNLMFSFIGKSNLIWYLFILVFHSSAAYFFYRFCFKFLILIFLMFATPTGGVVGAPSVELMGMFAFLF